MCVVPSDWALGAGGKSLVECMETRSEGGWGGWGAFGLRVGFG